MSKHVLAAVLVAVPCALLAGPARPCSPAMPSLDGPIQPDDGAAAVPTNAKLHVALQSGPVTFTARLLQGGEEVATLPVVPDAFLAIVDLGDLATDTAYTVELVGEPMFEGDEPLARTIALTTGSGPDDEAPTVTGTPTTSVTHHPAENSLFGARTMDCGGGSSEASNTVVVSGYTFDDDTDVAAVMLYSLDENGGRALRRVDVGGNGDELVAFEREPGTYRYAIVAVDLAGNESEPLEVEASVSGFGCSATTTGAGAPVGLVALALLVARARRCGRRA